MLATWARIVQTDNVVQAIGTVLLARLALLVALVLAMLLTESMSNSCKNSPAAHRPILLVVSNLALEVTSKVLLLAMTSSHGNAVLLVPLLLGNSVVAEMIVVDMIPVTPLQLEELHLGQEIVGAEATTVATPTMEARMAMAHPWLLLLHLGNKPPPILRLVLHLVGILATLHLDMALVTKEAWALLPGLLLLLD